MNSDEHACEAYSTKRSRCNRAYLKFKTRPLFSYAQIIQHLATLMVGYVIYDLWINDHCIKHHKIGDKLAHLTPFEKHRKSSLLIETDILNQKSDRQGIFINLLVQAVGDFIENIERAAQNGLRLFPEQKFRVTGMNQIRFPSVFICVHPW